MGNRRHGLHSLPESGEVSPSTQGALAVQREEGARGGWATVALPSLLRMHAWLHSGNGLQQQRNTCTHPCMPWVRYILHHTRLSQYGLTLEKVVPEMVTLKFKFVVSLLSILQRAESECKCPSCITAPPLDVRLCPLG